jgi:signal transduction histidine kinase
MASQAPSSPLVIGKTLKRRKQLENDLEHIQEEMYKHNLELVETNKTLSLLRSIDALILDSSQSLTKVSAQIAQSISETAQYPFIGIFTRLPHLEDELVLSGWGMHGVTAQKPLEFPKLPRMKMDDPWFASLEQSRFVNIEHVTAHQLQSYITLSTSELHWFKHNLPLKSLYVVKLFARNRVVGLLTVGFTETIDETAPNRTLLVDRLSESVGVALDNKLLFEENQHMVRQLGISNLKLKALDETKDDFISMASHQLRTPLTSIKGYLSMVLDGDAGDITPLQKKMLGQAFFSSQRMVYLIADLLNVSRLKTGKFIIEAAPANLADIVEQEMSQLKETAASRNLKLHYEKPKNFPLVMLDETKTRQVIMNFVDNAIYYTPAGGHVKVKLVQTPHTIEFRVEDDGIGVPKTEQMHLFSKFYRAGNARQARPDGTGLGLFMAKKVVVGQGGSIIFDSKEGKGSTFGFVFSKSKLAPTSAPKPVASETEVPKKPKAKAKAAAKQ